MSECALLPERFLLRCEGADVFPCLQGALTCDITPAKQDGRSVCGFLLTPQGKIIADMHIVPISGGVLLDGGGADIASVIGSLRLAALGRDVTVSAEDTLCAYALFGSEDHCPDVPETSPEEVRQYLTEFSGPSTVDIPAPGVMMYTDSRDCRLGFRLIASPASVQSFAEAAGATLSDTSQHYHTARIYCGMADAGYDIPPTGMFPLDIGAETYGAVSVRKGCYIGQEVVSRMYHKGERRKCLAIAGAQDGKTFDDVPSFSVLTDTDGAKQGILLSASGNAALALIKTQDAPIELYLDGVRLIAKPLNLIQPLN